MTRVTGRPGLLVWLTAVWVGLWGDLSWANLLGGVAVAVAVLLALPLDDVGAHGRVSPRGVACFAGVFCVQLVSASAQVAALVLQPRRELRSAVIAVLLHGQGDRLLSVVANAVSLTPGTLTLEADRERRTLFVHVLDVGAEAVAGTQVRADIARLERAAARALGQRREVHDRQEAR